MTCRGTDHVKTRSFAIIYSRRKTQYRTQLPVYLHWLTKAAGYDPLAEKCFYEKLPIYFWGLIKSNTFIVEKPTNLNF